MEYFQDSSVSYEHFRVTTKTKVIEDTKINK